MFALYDRIGAGYDGTRRADPSIVALLIQAVGVEPGDRVLDAACGTGNYAMALAENGACVVGLDISRVMLDEARGKAPLHFWIQGRAEALPFHDAAFDAVTCVNAVHHFAEDVAAFREFRRVLKPGRRLAIFTNTAEEVAAFWISRYFPKAVHRSATGCLPEARFSDLARLAALNLVDRLGWVQPADPIDLFLYCGKHRPELYFDPRIRAGISTFANMPDRSELEAGLARLDADIRSGVIASVIEAAKHSRDYSVFVFERPF